MSQASKNRWWTAPLVALIVLLTSPAQSRPPDEVAYDAALTAYKAGRLDDALASLKQAYSLAPRAIYLYNMGRVLDRSGHLSEAHETFLRATAQADADDALRSLCKEQLKRLGPLAGRAVLNFGSVAAGSPVQVGKVMVADLGVDVVLDAGVTVICVSSPAGEAIECHVRHFPAGRRLNWPPPKTATAPVELVNDLQGELTSIRIGEIAIQADWRRVSTVLLSGVVDDVSLRVGGGSVTPVDLALASGSPRTLSSLLPAARPTQASGEPPLAALTVEEGTSVQPGPWILVGTGAAAILSGIGLIAYAHVHADTPSDTTQSDASAATESALILETTGWSLGGAGLAAVAAGLGWYFIADKDDGPRLTVGIDARRDGGCVTLLGGF